ncbi:hypothetical protein CU098_004136 [Rhizopus stolonifer]|uniref:SMP-LTD domain-containing protein n=1 Tax=Rhizopus stolonifer TaxID=4846 RepID=A0A367JL21_RHIST|nr:hypothetical protein CU098_004136 [Rhizopus stolonifer]
MISYYLSLLLAYLIGGMTLIPLVLCVLYFSTQKKHVERTVDVLENQKDEFYKVGWLQVDHIHTLGKATSIGTIVKSYLSSKHPTPPYFAVLKFNTLYLYDSELQLDCKGIIHVNNHTVHIYPYGLKDHELFSKSSRILLKKKKRLFLEDTQQQKEYYLNCSRSVDKEDWYFALLKANKPSLQATEPKDATVFDQDAMNHLISTIHSNSSQFEMQWFNALLGRIFLGIYKTERTKSFFYNKILSKIEKLNARRPPFLEEISLRSVDGGHGPPQITQPRFIHLSPQGEYTGDVQLSYDGHFRVELETVLTWKYSDRLPPIRIDLVLAITLKSIEGKLMIKIKEPPTNRAWLGFYRKPKMEWIVEPVVWEKRIGFSVVSKAIQTKIEEILAETLVLPNMDDMVFFQTDGVGGIFEHPTVTKETPPDTSYPSLLELYSSPSELVVTADHFSTSASSVVTPPPSVKKRWFRRNSVYQEEVDISSDSDTPSQKTLKSVMLQNDSQANEKKNKRKTSSSHSIRHQFLTTHVDHSVHPIDTPQQKENESAAVRSLLLSKQMLEQTRARSKSLPSTGISQINVVNEKEEENDLGKR